MNSRTKSTSFWIAAVTGTLFSQFVYAHPGHDESVSFFSGLMHPFSGFDHFLVIVLVGFWSAFTLRRIWLGPVLFMLGMTLGAFSGLYLLPFEWFEFGIAASVIAMGALLLAKNQYLPKLVLLMIVAFGVFHGFAHAQVFANGNSGVSFVIQDLLGLILATGALHLLGAAIAKFLKGQTKLIAKVAGIASVIYGGLLIGQLSFALLSGA